MSDKENGNEIIKNDISNGRVADNPDYFSKIFPENILNRFEIYSYRSAAAILYQTFPEQFKDIIYALENLQVTKTMIRTPGGSKGPIAKHVDDLFDTNKLGRN